jgi:hypothetical protein
MLRVFDKPMSQMSLQLNFSFARSEAFDYLFKRQACQGLNRRSVFHPYVQATRRNQGCPGAGKSG